MALEGPFFIIAVMWLILAVYVSSEAQKEGRSGGFWFLFTLIFGILALLIWAGRANKGYDKDEIASNKPEGLLLSGYEIYFLRAVVVVSLLVGAFSVASGLLTGTETELVEKCVGEGFYRDCFMVEETTHPGSGQTLLGVLFLGMSLITETGIRIYR